MLNKSIGYLPLADLCVYVLTYMYVRARVCMRVRARVRARICVSLGEREGERDLEQVILVTMTEQKLPALMSKYR